MVRAFFLLLFLSACAGAPQKALSPASALGSFESAFVETGNDGVARSVAHIVSVDGQHGLVVYVSRKDGQAAGVSRAKVGDRAVRYERVSIADGVEGGLIVHSEAEMATAAQRGVRLSLCGQLGCYPVKVPAALYQQALLE